MGKISLKKCIMGILLINCFALANLVPEMSYCQTHPLTKAEIKAQEKAAKELAKAQERQRKEAEKLRKQQEKAARKEAERKEKECRKNPYSSACQPQTTRPAYYPPVNSNYYYSTSESELLKNEILSSYAITEQDRAHLTRFYSLRNYEPAFIRSGSITYTARELKNAVAAIGDHGLHASDYWDTAAENIFSGYSIGSSASAEIKLAQIFLKISSDLSVGRVDPRQVSAEIRYAPRSFTKYEALNSAVNGIGILETWGRIAPQHDRYLQLQVVLQRLRDIEAAGGFKSINPSGSILTIGVSGPTILALKTRAQQLGYIVDALDTTYDEQLEAIIKDIQEANMAPVTGILNPKDDESWEYFSVSSTRRIQQVELNMEKLRWLPESLGPRHLFVNLAKQSLEVIDPGLTNPLLRRQKIVGGRFERKTPSMQDRLTTVVLNPTWTVPVTIFSLDKLPKIQEFLNDPVNGLANVSNWFLTGRFVVYNGDMTRQIDPLTIDWMHINPKTEDYWIQQLPSYNNALGVTKFLLTNSESIYLHDTNDRKLFDESARLRSSGCMRISHPVELAEYVLSGTKWDMTKISETVAKENEVKDKETEIDIPEANRLPIYIMSLTAELGDDNVMRFTRDEYKQNLDLLTKLQSLGYMR